MGDSVTTTTPFDEWLAKAIDECQANAYEDWMEKLNPSLRDRIDAGDCDVE